MKSKLLASEQELRSFAVVLDSGDEAVAALTAFAMENSITAASVTAIGAFSTATVGWFDFDKSDYDRIEVNEQCEVLSILGDIAQGDDGKPSLHLHAVLGIRDGSTRGGHLLAGRVRPTLEAIVTETPAHLHRTRVPTLGIALIDLTK